MPLAIDASLRYGLGVAGHAAAEQSHLRSEHAVQHAPLQGPTADADHEPGLPSMRAAAKPATVDYLYYVRKPNSLRPLLHGRRAGVLRKGDRVRLQGC